MCFGDQTSWWEDAGMRTCSREAGPPGPQLSCLGEREWYTAMSGGAGEVNMLLSLFSLQLPLTHNLSNKVRGIFFLKKSSLVFIIALKCILHVYVYKYTTKTRNDFLVQVRNFLLPLSLKVLRHKERYTHSFYSGFSICPPPTCVAPVFRPLAWLRRASESQPSSPEAELNSTNWLFQNPQNPLRASSAWRHPHSVATFPFWVIVTSLSDTSAPRVRVTTCVNVTPK